HRPHRTQVPRPTHTTRHHGTQRPRQVRRTDLGPERLRHQTHEGRRGDRPRPPPPDTSLTGKHPRERPSETPITPPRRDPTPGPVGPPLRPTRATRITAIGVGGLLDRAHTSVETSGRRTQIGLGITPPCPLGSHRGEQPTALVPVVTDQIRRHPV